jgi:CRP/FNR family transcriptional regulator, cyclic AMP receptor protein
VSVPLQVDPDRQLIELFGSIPLFASLDDHGLKELLRLCRNFEVPSGSLFFRQGDLPDGLYVLWRGDVEVSIRTESDGHLVLARLGNGSVFGEMALIDGAPRSAMVQAVSQSNGLFLPRDAFEGLRATGASFADRVVLELARTLDQRRRTLEQRIRQILTAPDAHAELMQPSTKELIARFRKA